MTIHEILLSNRNLSDEWNWSIVRISTVSDTEAIIAEGMERTSEAALGKAKAWLLGLYSSGGRADDVANKVYMCARCCKVDPP